MFKVIKNLLMVSLASNAMMVDLSGRVVNNEGKGIPNVSVKLSGAGLFSTSDTSGFWRITGATTNVIQKTAKQHAPYIRITVNNGALIVSHKGVNVLGQSPYLIVSNNSFAQFPASRASLTQPDTLIYSLGENVFLRDTVSNYSSENSLRQFDSTVNSSIIHGYIIDARDSNQYRTIAIGSQVWMAENLKFKTKQSKCIGDTVKGCSIYGRLYSWADAMGVSDSFNSLPTKNIDSKGVCMTGWHIPTNNDIYLLQVYLDPNGNYNDRNGDHLKSKYLWENNSGVSGNGDDLYGFRALPGGYIDAWGDSRNLGYSSFFWTSTEFDSMNSRDLGLNYAYSTTARGTREKVQKYSIRCILDNTTP